MSNLAEAIEALAARWEEDAATSERTAQNKYMSYQLMYEFKASAKRQREDARQLRLLLAQPAQPRE